MPLSQDNIEAIWAWVEGDGCAIGGIYSQDGDLSSQLAKALCEDTSGHSMPKVLYVRTTPLEACLLEQEIVQAMPEAGGYTGVWSGEDDVPDVALTTYAVLHNYLRTHTGRQQPMFEGPTLVVFEHEIGVWVEGLITRDMLALVAAKLAEDEDGPWIKILGLSYSSNPQEWLQHPIRLMGDRDGRLSLDILVAPEDQVNGGSLRKAVWDRDGIEACAVEIAHKLKANLNVVVFSTPARFGALCDAVEGLHAGEFTALKDFFSEWPQVQLSGKALPVFTQAETLGHLIRMPHDGYPCGLPFERIGVVVIMPPGKKPVYSEEARVCLRSSISLTQPQFWIESTLRSSGQSSPSVVCFVGDTESLPKCANHLVNREDDYLAGWLFTIMTYPGRPIEELPFFGALSSPTYSRDCLGQLQVMGLIEPGSDRMGFVHTEQGARVMWADEYLANISLSGISALADVSMHLGGNMARSAARLILLLEHYPTTVKVIARQGDATSGDDFGLMLQELAVSSRNGGPGRKHVDRGSLWAAWVAFEGASSGMDLSHGNFEQVFTDPEIFPKMKKPSFFLRATGLRGFLEDLAFWEQKLGLDPLHRNDWADFQLSDSDADAIQDIMARAYYPYLLDVPVELKDGSSLKDSLGASLFRSRSIVRGTSPMYNFYKRLWAESAREKAPTQSRHLYAGVSTPALVLGDMGNEITANAVMVIPYGTALAVDKNGADKWARRNSGL
ncbi:hypothetical protein INS49_015206 [Diaporthe citri]|uniref:uncharacterized protein n=1 Tax=Diaporthe citri TaxID=83186 RepID=UPI001C7FA289|nr:uncharacterized protein INS49_015206 [Diaporthe citri]KAG6357328.1 hypothetical protein INS49_015206 [Diaporthe citri]